MCCLSWREMSIRTCSPEMWWTTCSTTAGRLQCNSAAEPIHLGATLHLDVTLSTIFCFINRYLVQKHLKQARIKLTCVLLHLRVENAIEEVATDFDTANQAGAACKVKQKARSFLQEMVANVSPAFIRLLHTSRNAKSHSPFLAIHYLYLVCLPCVQADWVGTSEAV